MMNILQINSSARHDASHSTRLANRLVQRLHDADPDATLTVRDLNSVPHPVLDEAALTALFTAADRRTPEQAARVALDDALIAEIQAADVVVVGVPMYNFGVPAPLKNWIDAISRAGVTFRYTEKGPEGLLGGKERFQPGVVAGLLDTVRDTMPADAPKLHLSRFFYLRGALRLDLRDKSGAITDFETALTTWPVPENPALSPLRDLYREAGDAAALAALEDRVHHRNR